MPRTPPLTPLQQAEQAREVVSVLGCLEDRIVAGGCGVGRRFLSTRTTCLVDAIDHACVDAMPGVADEVTQELARLLPVPFRGLGRHRPRLALSLYTDGLRDPGHVLDLVRAAHRRLGGAPRHPSAQRRRAPIVTDGG